MAKDKLVDYDSTASNNLDVGGISVAEGMLPSNVNNAIREQMSHLKDFAEGTQPINALAVDNLNMDGNTISSTDTNGNITLAPNGTGAVALSSTDLTFGDNDKAIFGAGSDLQIYHDGNHSYVTDQGTGNLRLRGSNFVQVLDASGNDMIQAEAGGAVDIYHNGSPKIATTSSGCDITGTVTASSNVTSKGGQLRINDGTTSLAGGMFTHKEITGGGTSNDTVIFTETGNKIRFATNGSVSDKVVIDTAGSVGIGTGTVAANTKLHVKAGTNLNFEVENASSNLRLSALNDARSANIPMQFASSQFEFISGNVVIAKTTTSNTVQGIILGVDGQLNCVIQNAGGASQAIFINRQDATGNAILFRYANGTVGSIAINTSSVSYNTSSDYRLKTAVTYDWDATSRLKQLKPARFKWIADGDDAVFVDGFLAHECEAVPEAITGTKDGMMDEEYTVSAATGDIYTPAVEATYDEDGVELTAAVDEVIHSADVERPEELAEGQQWRETTAAVMNTR